MTPARPWTAALLAAVVQHSFDEWLDRQPTWTLATTAEARVAVLTRVLRRTTRTRCAGGGVVHASGTHREQG